MNEELRWMLASINRLLQAKDYFGGFVMCLIAIDALGKNRYPKSNPGERFQRFLHEERQPFWGGKVFLPDAKKCRQSPKKKSPELGDFDGDIEKRQQALDAHLEELQKDLIPIEKVLWKYCRNPIVHEGSRLAVDGDTDVTLDWSAPPTSLKLKVDQEAKNVIVISAPFLLNVLYRIVAKHLGEDGPRMASS